MSLTNATGNKGQKENTKRRKIRIEVEAEATKKRKSIDAVNKKRDIGPDLNKLALNQRKNREKTNKDKFKANIEDREKAKVMKDSRDNVKKYKNIRKDNNLQAIKAIPVELFHQATLDY